jgi:PAS domain-containing protein
MPHVTFSQFTFLIASGLGIAALLILGVYALQKMHRGQLGYADLKSPRPRIQDETAFVTAAFQGIVKDLKDQQKKQEQLLRAAEQRADANFRQFALICREMVEGVVQISKEGFIVFANPAARSLLEMAAPSHRLYSEVFGADTKFCQVIRACLEAGVVTRRQRVDYLCPNRKPRPLLASVVPLATPQETIEGAICLLRDFAGDNATPGHSEVGE